MGKCSLITSLAGLYRRVKDLQSRRVSALEAEELPPALEVLKQSLGKKYPEIYEFALGIKREENTGVGGGITG